MKRPEPGTAVPGHPHPPRSVPGRTTTTRRFRSGPGNAEENTWPTGLWRWCWQAAAWTRVWQRQVEHFGPEHSLAVAAPHLGQIGGSSLTDAAIDMPADDTPGEVPSTYVPFRNANLLAIAVSWAETIGAGRIVIGAVEQDAPGYPDCRAAFYEAANRLIDLGTRPDTQIRVAAPLVEGRRRADGRRPGRTVPPDVVLLPLRGRAVRALRELSPPGRGVHRSRRARPACVGSK